MTQRCLGCKAALPEGVCAAVCVSCEPREGEVYLQKLAHLQGCERLFWQTMVECQRITGTIHKEVIGIARDSQIYYMLKKAKKDLTAAKETMARFEVAA